MHKGDQTHQADFNDTLFFAMELSRATWLVATFAPRLGNKIGVHPVGFTLSSAIDQNAANPQFCAGK
jgi:hypothetical protein